MSATRLLSYRLKSEGKAEVIRDAADVGAALRGSYAQAEAGAAAAGTAADRQQAKFLRMADAARNAGAAEARRADIDRTLNANLSSMPGVAVLGAAPAGSSARDSAAVFQAEAAAMEAAEARAVALRAAIDPLGAAQDRLNDELREYQGLATAGMISTRELGQAQAQARQRFDDTAAAISRQERGMSRLVVASRLNLARQGADVAVTAAMGMNPAMIAIQQGPQILDALATSGFKARGSLLLLSGAVTAVAAGVAVLGAAYLGGEANALKLERATTGLGRASGLTALEVDALAMASADQAKVSIASARDQAIAYVSTGRIGGEVIGKLIALGRDYASVMGLDAEGATEALAKAMASPDKAARELTRSIGLMDQKTLDHIDTLIKSGQQYQAQTILVDALSDRMKGHADQISEVDSLWQNATRALSDYWTDFNSFIYQTRQERVEAYDGVIRNARRDGANPVAIERMVAQRDSLSASVLFDRERAFLTGISSRENQSAQDATDRRARNRPARSGNGDAEREARERQARERREEDRDAYIDLEVARAANDFETLRRLEHAIAVRTRERQLIDDGLSADRARLTALQEQSALIQAREVVFERERAGIAASVELEASRIDGLDRFVERKEREAAIQERILAYQTNGLDLATATAAATSDQLILDEARATAAERNAAAREREHQIALASARGDRRTFDSLSRDDWIDRRAREIESASRTPMNRGEGDAQARREWDETVAAEAEGARRDWVKGFVEDIRRGGIRDALAEQLEQAADRMVDRLIDSLFEMDWSKIFGTVLGGGDAHRPIGGGLGDIFSILGTAGRNAKGTEFWRGGLSWVGEEGPELLNLPRGSQVFDHQKSLRMAAGAGAQVVNHYYLEGAVTTDELWKRIDRGDQQAARAGARQGASTAVSVVEASAAEKQRAERMMRG